MRRFVLGAVAVGGLVAFAAVLGRDGAPEPFVLETRVVQRIPAASSEELADAIAAQLPYGDRAARPPRAAKVFDPWIDLLRQTVYRDQAPANGLARKAPSELFVGGIGGEDRANRTYLAASESAIRRLVSANARRLGMRVVSISFLYPEAIPVPVAVLSAPPALVRRSGGAPLGASVFAGAADETRSLGWYADIVDERGDWVQSAGLVPAAGSGEFATRFPEATGCGGLVFCSAHA